MHTSKEEKGVKHIIDQRNSTTQGCQKSNNKNRISSSTPGEEKETDIEEKQEVYLSAQPKRWKNLPPPNGLIAVKGSVHIVVNRDYVNYVLHNKPAHDLLLWTKKTWIPDETFFAMLNANPKLGIRGTYTGIPEHNSSRPFLARYKNWIGTPCAGKFIREICILTTGDLPRLANASQLFANKFFLQEDRVVIGCLEEKIFNDTRDEYMGSKTFNTTYYENLDFVKHKIE